MNTSYTRLTLADREKIQNLRRSRTDNNFPDFTILDFFKKIEMFEIEDPRFCYSASRRQNRDKFFFGGKFFYENSIPKFKKRKRRRTRRSCAQLLELATRSMDPARR